MIFTMNLITLLFRAPPLQINWQPVIGGLFIQLVLAVLTLQTYPGYITFKFLGDRMTEFLSHSTAGSDFVFSGLTQFAFTVRYSYAFP